MKSVVSQAIDLITKNHKVGFLTVLLFVLAAHGNIFQNQFVMDDIDFIVHWPLIHDWKNFPQFFIGYIPPAGQEGIYSPLKTVFHSLNYHLFGLNPLGYHIVSILIHFVGILFVYKISFALTEKPWASLLSSLFFGLHPVQVEAITYMTASVDMIGIVFLFAAFFWYLKTCDIQGHFKLWPYTYSIVFSILAVFTHELAISLPFLFLWYDFCYLNKRGTWKNIITRVAPFFIITGLYAASKLLILKSITRGAYLYDSFTLTMLVMVKAWAKYVYLCLFPNVLTHNHMISEGISSFDPDDFDATAVLTQSLFDMQTLIAILVLGGILYCAVRNYKKQPVICFCLGWFFIALLPVSNIIPSGVFFGERYLYGGLLGFSLLLGLFVEHLYRREGALFKLKYQGMIIFLVLCIATAYSVRTWIRNKNWKDEISLYKSAVKANFQSALMRTDLGVVYLEKNYPEKAIESFKIALKIRPDDPVIYFSMANAYLSVGKKQKAIQALQNAIIIDPVYPEAYYNLAGIYASLQMAEKAIQNLNISLKYLREQGRGQDAQEYEGAFRAYFGSL